MDPESKGNAQRENALVDAIVTLADTLVKDFDIVELFDLLVRTCTQTLGAHGAGLVLHDRDRGLHVVASSSEHPQFLELLQVQSLSGPCAEAYRNSRHVAETDLSSGSRWPQFARAALRSGFAAVVALPLRLRTETIGALTLLYEKPRSYQRADVLAAQALADVTTIGVLNHLASVRADSLVAQLQNALETRAHIEQLKGLLAERGESTADVAFDLFRRYCHERRVPMSETARRIMMKEVDPDEVLAMRWPSDPRGVT